MRALQGIDLQSLAVGGEARDAHQRPLVDLEDSLEVAVHGHQLGGQTRVSRNRHAVLALHGDHRVAVVLVLSNQNKSYLASMSMDSSHD